MALFTHTKKERSFKKVSAFLNVTEDLLNQQDPNLIMKMIKAADDDEMFDVHRFGMEMLCNDNDAFTEKCALGFPAFVQSGFKYGQGAGCCILPERQTFGYFRHPLGITRGVGHQRNAFIFLICGHNY
jgi:hypothetical protein